MPILYSVISRDTIVLAEFTECVGNFEEFSKQIIYKIPPENHKKSFYHGEFHIHYICKNGIIYMCITDDELKQERAFMFLNYIKQKFVEAYGSTMATAEAYNMDSAFKTVLSTQMAFHSFSRAIDVQFNIEEVKEEARKVIEYEEQNDRTWAGLNL